jgi:putative phage-type endonuclease
LYLEKRGEIAATPGNDATTWGSSMEPVIRQWYADTTGRKVRVPSEIIECQDHPFLRATLDGVTDCGRVLEIKTSRLGRDWGAPGTNAVPDHYALQCQHYMLVTGLAVADLAVSISGAPPQIFELGADRELHGLIIDAARDFWERVLTGNPPEPLTYADAVERFGKGKAAGTVVVSPDALEASRLLQITQQLIEQLKTTADHLKAGLILELGDFGDTLITSDGEIVCTYKLAKSRTGFDQARFRLGHPELWGKYQTTGLPTRRLILKGKKNGN